MKIIYGEAFDGGMIPRPIEEGKAIHGEMICGPLRLLEELELRLGLTGQYPNNVLRVEQYRQAMVRLSKSEHFYWNSFQKDQYAVAKDLLHKRDELVMAGFDLTVEGAPERIVDICEVETEAKPSPGIADRFRAVLAELETDLGLEVISYTSKEELTTPVSRIFEKLNVEYKEVETASASGDLSLYQNYLVAESREEVELAGDGSLEVWRAGSEMELAEYVASYLKEGGEKPFIFNPEGQVVLNECLVKEGFPSLGSVSYTSARPSLQLLPLIQSFLWEPMDPKRILEFLTLPVRPLRKNVAQALAGEMATSPGMGSDSWNKALTESLGELDGEQKKKTEERYKFLFERKRYKYDEEVPLDEVIELYKWLGKYCSDRNRLHEDEHTGTLSTVANCCRELSNLLIEVKKTNTNIDKLFLENLVSDITPETSYKGIPDQVGQLSAFSDSRALTEQVPILLWFPFVHMNEFRSGSFWSTEELAFLQEKGAQIPDVGEQNIQKINHAITLIKSVSEKLILCLPENLEGEKTHPHSLFVDLQAMAKNIEVIDKRPLETGSELEEKKVVDLPTLEQYIQVDSSSLLKARDKESYSSLENLFYYPSDWFLNYVAKIKGASLLDISDGPLLYGNLAHKLIEDFYTENKVISAISESVINGWLDSNFDPRIQKEGANLLMPGREHDLIELRAMVTEGLSNITKHAQDNGWELVGPEEEFTSEFCGVTFGGLADLVFKRGDEIAIVDVKYGNKTKRRDLLKHNEDLQLAFYSKLYESNGKYDHTAFYILTGRTLMAKNNQAFKDADVPTEYPDTQKAYDELWDKMEETYRIRIAEIEAGQVEVRNSSNATAINTKFAGTDTLTPPKEENEYSDYENITGWGVENE